MKLQFRQIESFVKAPSAAMRAILVYGPDAGLVRERAAVMGRTVVADLNDPFNVGVLSSDTVVSDMARLMDEAAAISMMGGRRLVRIEDGRDALAPALKEYLKTPNDNALVIIEAGELGPKSPLRLLFEKAENAAALPCYVEDERDIATLARNSLQEQGYNIAPDALGWLAASITGDRARARSEIEKLTLYMGANKQIGIDDVLACCGDTGAQSLDMLVYGVAGGKTDEALRAYATLLQEGVSIITILRVLQNHFRRLHVTRARVEQGDAPDQAMKMLQPPIFFKQEAAFRAQVQKWSLPGLEKILQRLNTLEAQGKQTGTPIETLCSQALLAISRAA